MKDKSALPWVARNEEDKMAGLEVLYEMAIGYVLSELRDEHSDRYEQLANHTRRRSQLINNVRYSVDIMLTELLEEYGNELLGDCEDKR